jgi:hypothetical protein
MTALSREATLADELAWAKFTDEQKRVARAVLTTEIQSRFDDEHENEISVAEEVAIDETNAVCQEIYEAALKRLRHLVDNEPDALKDIFDAIAALPRSIRS